MGCQQALLDCGPRRRGTRKAASRALYIGEVSHTFYTTFSQQCSLCRAVYEFYACGPTYEHVYEQTRRNSPLWFKYIPNTTFRFTVSGFNRNITLARQKEVVETFSFMALEGRIDMKNAELNLCCMEECESVCLLCNQ